MRRTHSVFRKKNVTYFLTSTSFNEENCVLLTHTHRSHDVVLCLSRQHPVFAYTHS